MNPDLARKTLGQVAFEAHRDQLGGVRQWSEVRESEREVWEGTGAAVAQHAASQSEEGT